MDSTQKLLRAKGKRVKERTKEETIRQGRTKAL
jgi:hypothetical protein